MLRNIFGKSSPCGELNRFIAMLAFTALCFVLLAVVNVERASAAQQPYGGCDEAWQAPHSAGAADCRDLGWIVRPRLIIDPHGLVRMSALPHCTFEDASTGPVPCSYNFGGRLDGFGNGLAFWTTGTNRANYVHYVWTHGPRNGWRWVDSGLADALAEGGADGATTRDWQQCKYLHRAHWTVRCADGVYLRD